MISNQKLFSVGNFDFRLQHLLIIGILALSVSISMLLRSTPASYGFELFEFDPFFNFRATDYILENGPDAYFNWIDEKSWYPFGRNVSETSQVSLHFTTAALYPIFNFGLSLYDFTILMPLIFGSLTTIVVFAFVRVLGGTSAGLLAALIFSVSVPIFTRGLIGWFKSEPLGLFFGFIAIYLFVSGIKNNKGKISFLKLIFAGLFLSIGLSSWGGILFFMLAIALFYFALPFIKNEKNFLIWATPSFSIALVISSLLFERTSTFFTGGAVIGYAGLAIILPTIFVVICEIIKKFGNEKNTIRNCLIFLGTIIAIGVGVVQSGFSGLPSFRYLNAVNPFLTSTDALTDSVAEHMTTQLTLSFAFLSIFMVFSLIGIWLIFSRKDVLKLDMKFFALIIGFIAIYISSAFVRLELFASVGMIILASIGLSILFKEILQLQNKKPVKLIFTSIIVILFIIPVVSPENNSWSSWADFPPSLLNGGSSFSNYSSDDWKDAMNWLKNNTPTDSVIAAWWDYGYWISTLSDRATLADNATIIDWQIKKIAYSLITTPENSWNILNSHYSQDVSKYIGDENIRAFGGMTTVEFEEFYMEKHGKSCTQIFKNEISGTDNVEETCNPVTKGMNADYILIFIAGERFYSQNSNIPLYTLEGGGDESKKTWFAKISNHQVSKFVQSDNITPTDNFMNNTTLGQLIPFSTFKYVELNTGRTFDTYQNGLIPVYVNDLKLKNPDTDPYFLVYASPSFYSTEPGPITSVLIYKINSEYNP